MAFDKTSAIGDQELSDRHPAERERLKEASTIDRERLDREVEVTDSDLAEAVAGAKEEIDLFLSAAGELDEPAKEQLLLALAAATGEETPGPETLWLAQELGVADDLGLEEAGEGEGLAVADEVLQEALSTFESMKPLLEDFFKNNPEYIKVLEWGVKGGNPTALELLDTLVGIKQRVDVGESIEDIVTVADGETLKANLDGLKADYDKENLEAESLEARIDELKTRAQALVEDYAALGLLNPNLDETLSKLESADVDEEELLRIETALANLESLKANYARKSELTEGEQTSLGTLSGAVQHRIIRQASTVEELRSLLQAEIALKNAANPDAAAELYLKYLNPYPNLKQEFLPQGADTPIQGLEDKLTAALEETLEALEKDKPLNQRTKDLAALLGVSALVEGLQAELNKETPDQTQVDKLRAKIKEAAENKASEFGAALEGKTVAQIEASLSRELTQAEIEKLIDEVPEFERGRQEYQQWLTALENNETRLGYKDYVTSVILPTKTGLGKMMLEMRLQDNSIIQMIMDWIREIQAMVGDGSAARKRQEEWDAQRAEDIASVLGYDPEERAANQAAEAARVALATELDQDWEGKGYQIAQEGEVALADLPQAELEALQATVQTLESEAFNPEDNAWGTAVLQAGLKPSTLARLADKNLTDKVELREGHLKIGEAQAINLAAEDIDIEGKVLQALDGLAPPEGKGGNTGVEVAVYDVEGLNAENYPSLFEDSVLKPEVENFFNASLPEETYTAFLQKITDGWFEDGRILFLQDKINISDVTGSNWQNFAYVDLADKKDEFLEVLNSD